MKERDMKKLSATQEAVLRQIEAGQVALVRIRDNDHSTRVWDAIGKGGKRVNRQYDALHKAGLLHTPLNDWPVLDTVRKTVLSDLGQEAFKALGRPGKLIVQGFATGSGDSWEVRLEKGETQPYVLYYNGRLHARYSKAENVYAVYRTHCPYVENTEAVLSR